MQSFTCHGCGQPVYLRNSWCTACQKPLGFSPADWDFRTLPTDAPALPARFCARQEQGVCNWLLADDDPEALCLSCRMTEVIPNLSWPDAAVRLYRIEHAKRRLLITLKEMGIPVFHGETRTPLRFAFKADLPGEPPVMTGHASGLITINIKEADPVARTEEQELMGEPQRTLLGHFRHESGHFYWDEWFKDDETWLARFRDLFGDERRDYAEALREHHTNPRPWDPLQPKGMISKYAQSHPWEDWAETWAHYLLMLDALSELTPTHLAGELMREHSADELIDRWVAVTLQSNAIVRSLGLPDAYPFVVDEGVRNKLAFVHDVVDAHAQAR